MHIFKIISRNVIFLSYQLIKSIFFFLVNRSLAKSTFPTYPIAFDNDLEVNELRVKFNVARKLPKVSQRSISKQVTESRLQSIVLGRDSHAGISHKDIRLIVLIRSNDIL